MTVLTCVRCDAQMRQLEIDGHPLLACPDGHGAWVEQLVLEQLVDDEADTVTPADEDAAWRSSDAAPAALSSERFRNCPVCRATLRKDVWKYGSGVVVDACDEHGVWVDAGEIERIEAWTEAWHAHAG